MSESTKKQPSWLEGHLLDPAEQAPGNNRPKKPGKKHAETPLSSVPEFERNAPGIPSTELLERVRANPAPLTIVLLAVLVLGVFFWLVVLRGSEESSGLRISDEGVGNSERDPGIGTGQIPDNPFSGGAVRDTNVVFGALQVEDDGQAQLNGAGLDWSGSVAEKEGGGGETVTLEGPTAAQLERGFDLGSSSVETGVYAIAQRSGEVLHVSTHTYRPQDPSGEVGTAAEKTLGTVYALRNGEVTGYAYYLDERGEGTDRVTRTYIRPGQESYRVSFTAQPGTFAPLLVGWRGFENTQEEQQQKQGEE